MSRLALVLLIALAFGVWTSAQEKTLEARAQNELQFELKSIRTTEEALLLMVEFQWRRLRARHGQGFRFECPVSFGNPSDIFLVQGSMQVAQAHIKEKEKQPFDGKEWKVEFYRAFWKDLFLRAAPQRNPALKNIDKKWLLGEKEDGLGGTIGKLALESTGIFRHAANKLNEYDKLVDVLSNLNDRQRKVVLDILVEGERSAESQKRLRDSLETRIKEHEGLTKEERERRKREAKFDEDPDR